MGVGVTLYYDLKYNRYILAEGLFFSRMAKHASIVSLLCKRPVESNVVLTDVWFFLSNLSSVNRFLNN